jgi:hypothetical protein
MNNKKLNQGQEVYFIGEKAPMILNEINENYAICTRSIHRRHDADILKDKVEMGGYCTFTEAYNDLKDSLIYSILDFKNNIKGPHNSWGYGIEKKTLKKDAKEILKALESNEIEISRRNSCQLNIDWEMTLKL